MLVAHKDTLNALTVKKAEKIFDGAVKPRDLLFLDLGKSELTPIGERLTEILGERRHFHWRHTA